MCENIIKVSPLNKTWILDLDGTIVKHNGYKLDGFDSLLPGAEEFLKNIQQDDMVIFVTSRKQEECGVETVAFLQGHNIRYNHIIWNAPYGERIIVNDRKPSGLNTAMAVNTERDEICNVVFEVDDAL